MSDVWVAILVAGIAGVAVLSFYLFQTGKPKEAMLLALGALSAVLMALLRREDKTPTEPMERPHRPDPKEIADAGISAVEEHLESEVEPIRVAVAGDDPEGDVADIANARTHRRESDR